MTAHASKVDVREFGAVGDGSSDDTAALRDALAASDRDRVTITLPPGVYVATGPIADPTLQHYAIEGASSARGCNAVPTPWAASTIRFRPADLTQWLISVYTLGEATKRGYSGPYEHRNVAFDLGDANGLQFGLCDATGDGKPDVVEDYPVLSPLQAATYNVRLDGCNFFATQAERASDPDGRIVRSGRIQMAWTKCYESVVTNTSFSGGDTQVLCWGCDRPTFIGIRSQLCHLPFAMYGSGTFGAGYTIRDLQVEGWTFAPVSSHHCALVLEGGSFEQNDYSPGGSGRFPIGMAKVTRGQPVLLFPRPMDGILFPDLSLIEVSSRGQRVPALVAAVDGAVVAVRDVTMFPWSDDNATITRIHGYGPLHDSHADAMVTDCQGNASLGCPAWVWVEGRGSMHLKAGGTLGERGDNRSLIVGNRPLGQSYLNSCMSFSGCSPVVTAEPEHPFAVVSGVAEDYGFDATGPNASAPLGSLDAAFASTNRRWAMTPKRSKNYVNVVGMNCIPYVRVPGEPYTGQNIWCWQIGHEGVSQGLVCSDKTLPSVPDAMLRIRFRGRSTRPDAVTLIKWRAIAAIWEPIGPINILPFPPRWTTHDLVIPTPAVWQDARRNESVGFLIEAEGVYLAGVTVEELSPLPAIADARTSTDASATVNTLLALLRANGIIRRN